MANEVATKLGWVVSEKRYVAKNKTQGFIDLAPEVHAAFNHYQAALEADLPNSLGLQRSCVPVLNTRNIGKAEMRNNDVLPKVKVDPQTYEVFADGELLTCDPAEELSMAQRYLLL